MISFLSNVTINGVFFSRAFGSLTGECLFFPAGYNTWAKDLLNPSENLLQSKAVFLLLDGREFACADPEKCADALDFALKILEQSRNDFPSLPLIASSLDIPCSSHRSLTSPDWELLAMSRWRSGLEKLRIPVLDLAELAWNMGRDNFYSAKLRIQAHMPFSMDGEKALARECYRCFKALTGNRKKVLVLDLDNTLWGGVIGEDGIDGITLGDSGSGQIYVDLQKRILNLKNQGVILAVASKNNPEDALAAIREHPHMALKENDFTVIKANWLPKAENIREIASELNLGSDSFVFIDDNPVERNAVKLALPEVDAPEFPQNPYEIEKFFNAVERDYFSAVAITAEDLNKSRQYLAEKNRKAEKEKFANIEEYLASLDMKLYFYPASEKDISRIAQLTQKTNQFNLTTRRYTESDISKMLKDPSCHIWLGELADRFGEYGKIILCIARTLENTVKIDTFLMSCRVMGRGVEDFFLHLVETELETFGLNTLNAEYIKTGKNQITESFWPSHGYKPAEINNTFIKGLPDTTPVGSTIQIIKSRLN